MNRDFVEMLSALCAAKVDFLVVGAHAVAAHGQPRATGDLDIWVRPTKANAKRVLAALRHFGAPLFDTTVDELSTPGLVLQIGVAPCRVDILTSVSGVTFKRAWPQRLTASVEGLSINFIGFEDLRRRSRLGEAAQASTRRAQGHSEATAYGPAPGT